MITVRLEEKPTFSAAGRKTWISGQGNEQFGAFWAKAHEDGLIGFLRSLRKDIPGPITGGFAFGISCVEKDPSNREFDFFIAAETDGQYVDGSLTSYQIPAYKWAIFTNHGELPESLVTMEMYAVLEWLPASPYQHAYGPELEVYPAKDGSAVEFWLPIEEK